MKPVFSPGKNIAMKVPPHEYESMVSFYRDIIGLEQVEASSADKFESVAFDFGGKKLWIDKVSSISQAETWLEIVTDDITGAEAYLKEKGMIRCDAIEPLPADFKGFWISSPANIIHLVTE